MANVTGTITDWIMGLQKVVPPAPAPVLVQPAADEKLEDDQVVEEIDDKELPPPVTSVRQLSFQEKLRRVLGILWEDLRVRTGTIFFVLWIMNLVPISCYATLTSQIYP